jgi:hypothetical protein
LNNFTFSDGATASGSFDYDAATNTFSSIHIVTTGTSLFPGATYTAVDPGFGPFPFDVAFITGSLSNYTGTPALELGFVTSLTNLGGTIGTDINEFVCTNNVCGAATDIRGTLDGGTVVGAVATPEPSVLLLLSFSLLALLGFAKRPA